MKKQRKIVSILLVLAMVIATGAIMTGCGDDPLETYNKASENMAKADNMSFDGDGKMAWSVSGQSLEMNLGIKGDYIKSTTDDPTDLQLAADVSFSMMGQNSSVKLYIKDKYAYMDNGAQKTKTKVEKASADQIASLFDEESTIKIDKYVKESSQDGDTLKFKIDSEKYITEFMKKYSSVFDSNNQNSTGSFNLKSFQDQIKNAGLEDMDLQATVKDDNFTSMKFSIPMTMDGSAYGSTQKVKADITFDLSKIDVNTDLKDVTIPNEKSFKEL